MIDPRDIFNAHAVVRNVPSGPTYSPGRPILPLARPHVITNGQRRRVAARALGATLGHHARRVARAVGPILPRTPRRR